MPAPESRVGEKESNLKGILLMGQTVTRSVIPLNCGNLGSKRVKFNHEVEQVEYEVESEEEPE